MTYSIIGAGKVGAAVAQQFARSNLPVSIASRRDPSALRDEVEQLGAAVSATTIEQALEADVLFLAIPFTAVEQLGGIREDWSGKVIVDQTNAYGVAPEVLAGRLSSEVVAAAFPGAALVKAFNQLPAALLARDPSDSGGKRVVFVATNDDSAGQTIVALAEQLGFSPINVGRIDEGGRLLHVPGPLVLRNLTEQPLKP